jgi:hypothetical protein
MSGLALKKKKRIGSGLGLNRPIRAKELTEWIFFHYGRYPASPYKKILA